MLARPGVVRTVGLLGIRITFVGKEKKNLECREKIEKSSSHRKEEKKEERKKGKELFSAIGN